MGRNDAAFSGERVGQSHPPLQRKSQPGKDTVGALQVAPERGDEDRQGRLNGTRQQTIAPPSPRGEGDTAKGRDG